MNQGFDEFPFNPSLNDSIQFPNSFGNGGGEGVESVNMPPPSPRSSFPVSSLYSHNPFNVGDGGKRVGMPPRPPSPRSSFGHSSPYYQNPLNNDGGMRIGTTPPSPQNSFPPSSRFIEIPTTRQQSNSPLLSQLARVYSLDQFPPLSPSPTSLSQPPPLSSFDQFPPVSPTPSLSPLPPLSPFAQLPPLSPSPSLPQPIPLSSLDQLPPLSPLPPLSQTLPLSSFDHFPSLSQPSQVSSFDSLQPLFRDSPSTPLENRDYSSLPPIPYTRKKDSESSEPPRKTHRRTMSEIPSDEWDQILSQPLPAIEDEALIISSFMNLDTNDSNGTNTRANANKNKNRPPQKSTHAGVKRRAGKEIAAPSRTVLNRSLSVDSCSTGKLIIRDESPKLPANSSENGSNKLTISEMKMIEGEEKLIKRAESDPKGVRRILNNRNSAQRSHSRMLQYRKDLEDRVIKVENKNTSLSCQLANAQRENIKLTSQIKELMVRLEASEKQAQASEQHAQAMEKQMKHSEALAQNLNSEVQWLKLVVIGEDSQFYSQSERPNVNH